MKSEGVAVESGKSRPGSGAGRFYLLGCGLVLAAMGALFFSWLWRGYVHARVTMDWVSTPAQVVSAGIEEGRFSGPGDRRYRLRLRYRYAYGGREWIGDRITRRDGETRYWERKQRLLERYAPGTEVICYVNPAAPGEAVLRHETRAPGYTVWFPALFVAGGLGMAGRALYLIVKASQ